MALFELMVRKPWRKTGTAHRIHEELLSVREEERMTLLVEPTHAKVKALYEGYVNIGDQKPFPDPPVYTTAVRPLSG
ncbi:acetyltransferase [Streptomyces sp. NPDC014861]|uniref:acetyltransferase n=1 Tax=Streptomyces sp. NPDC014861 TaxID=3364923 RepID=UPI0036FA9A8B